MKKNIFKTISLFIFVFVIFTSCGVKEYSGFVVNKGIIEITDEENNNLSMPLKLYQEIEKNLLTFAEKFNYFGNITSKDFEYYKNLTIDIYSIDLEENHDNVKKSLSKIINDEKVLQSVIKSLNNMDNSLCENVESFVKELSDNFDILIYVMGEVADFDSGKAPWYKSRKDMFEDSVSDEDDVKSSIAFIEKYFPSVNLVLNYEETGAGKADK